MSLYFDYNATTPLDERVLAAMLPFLSTFYANPSSLYKQGRVVRSAIDTAREQVAALVGASANQVIFTSGGTEANNLALASLNPQSGLAISTIEHPSISEPARQWQQRGQPLHFIAVDTDGRVGHAAIDDIIGKRPEQVAIMLANNETGVIQAIEQYAPQLSVHGIRVHTDAVQAVGKIPVNFNALGVNSLALSSHKIYGPKGAGALIVADNTVITPLLWGGGQERNYRAGTENTAAIIGFGTAAELALMELNTRRDYLLKLRNLLEQQLALIPNLTLFAQQAERLPNTIQFGIAGIDGEMLLMQLDLKGIAVSSGSACASGANQPSPVLMAMGINETQAKTAIRISLGMNNTPADIEAFIKVLTVLIN